MPKCRYSKILTSALSHLAIGRVRLFDMNFLYTELEYEELFFILGDKKIVLLTQITPFGARGFGNILGDIGKISRKCSAWR